MSRYILSHKIFYGILVPSVIERRVTLYRELHLAGTDRVALVDEEDYPLLSRYKWSLDAKGYVKTSLVNTTVRLHRLILNPGKFDQVDHHNHDKLDNRKCNLRMCTNALNQANTRKRSGTSSKYKGVHWRKDLGKWASRISNKGKRIYLGYFDNEEDAAKAYNKKAEELWGDFALLNNIKESDAI